MSGIRHKSADFVAPVDGLPLFDAVKDTEAGQEKKDNKAKVDQILTSHYFDVPIPLESTYSNTSLKENERPVKFLGVVVDTSGNKGFSIEVDHDYQKEYHKSYTRDWHKKGYKGERDIYTYYRRQTGKKQYTVFSTWWKGENQMLIEAYNGKVKRTNSKKSDILSREGLYPLVIEMVNIASRKGLL